MSEVDPAELARTKFPGLSDERRVAIVERAREMARKDGGGILLLPAASVDSLLNLAERAETAAAKSKGETPFTSDELAFMNAAKLAFGKSGIAKPLAYRGEFLRVNCGGNVAKFNAEMAKWGASPTDLSPHKNPYPKAAKKALRAAREGDLDDTLHNQIFHADQIAKPRTPKVKLTPEQKGSNPFFAANWNVTKQAQLYKLDPNLANSMAQRAGVKIGATRPVM